MARDYRYLKSWIDAPISRPIILECEVSKSGMSMSVWDRDVKIFTIGGCGFDRIGRAIARVLQVCWQAELDASDADRHYGARRYNGHTWLEGSAGYSSMIEIGACLGLRIQALDSHHGAIIHITRA